MRWGAIGYALLCVVAPMAWGLLIYFVSNRIEDHVKTLGRKRGQDEETATMPPLDYHI